VEAARVCSPSFGFFLLANISCKCPPLPVADVNVMENLLPMN
jgi:hypothetical protein